ncbi:MAG: sulfite exporter TauE/SafE family protein [Pseudomonadota bacterium]
MIEAFLAEFSLAELAIVAVIAFGTAIIHGATGIAGGFLLAAALLYVIDVMAIVPVMSVAMLVSHATRALVNLRDVNLRVFASISLFAVPMIIIGAIFYSQLHEDAIALILGLVILASIPIRAWARQRKVKAGRRSLHLVGAIYGGLAGTSIGPGLLLVPFMLGYGLAKEAFVATLAAIGLLSNIMRISMFSGLELLSINHLLFGLWVGIMTIPGNWIGRGLLRSMAKNQHSRLVDILTILGAANMFWFAL